MAMNMKVGKVTHSKSVYRCRTVLKIAAYHRLSGILRQRD